MKTIKNLTFAALAATLLFQTSMARAADQGPKRIKHITFQKCFVEEGIFVGTVDGDWGVGTVIFTSASEEPGPVVWRFSGFYTVTTSKGSFTAFCIGIDALRSGSGHVVLHGVVIDGDHLGARVHVDAQDTNGGACSQGTITITPGK